MYSARSFAQSLHRLHDAREASGSGAGEVIFAVSQYEACRGKCLYGVLSGIEPDKRLEGEVGKFGKMTRSLNNGRCCGT